MLTSTSLSAQIEQRHLISIFIVKFTTFSGFRGVYSGSIEDVAVARLAVGPPFLQLTDCWTSKRQFFLSLGQFHCHGASYVQPSWDAQTRSKTKAPWHYPSRDWCPLHPYFSTCQGTSYSYVPETSFLVHAKSWRWSDFGSWRPPESKQILKFWQLPPKIHKQTNAV